MMYFVREENFSSTLLGLVFGALQIKLRKDRLKGKKHTIFINICMHRSSQKRSETQRNG